jgi:hypothetical protein
MKLDEGENRENLIQLFTLLLTVIICLSFTTAFAVSRLWQIETRIQRIEQE